MVKDGEDVHGLRTTEKFLINFSRCANQDVAPLTVILCQCVCLGVLASQERSTLGSVRHQHWGGRTHQSSAHRRRLCFISRRVSSIQGKSGTLFVFITASCCMEDGCLGYPRASTMTSPPLDSITLPWLAIPATQPWPPGSRHTDLTVVMGRGVWGGEHGEGGRAERCWPWDTDE